MDVRVLKLSGAKDPDEYIKDKGRDAFAHLLTVSKTKFEYNMDSVLSKYDLAVAQDRIQAVTELVKFIAEFHSSSERDVYIKAVSEKTGIQAASIRTDVEATMRRNQAARRRNEGQLVRQTTAGVFDKVNTDYSKAPSTAKKEETVLGLLLLFPAHRKRVFDGALLSEDDFFTDFGKRVFAFLKEEYGAEDRPEASFDRVFTSEEVGRITKLKLSRMSLTENGDEVLGDAIEDLKRAQRKQASGQAGTYAELDQLLASMRQSKT